MLDIPGLSEWAGFILFAISIADVGHFLINIEMDSINLCPFGIKTGSGIPVLL